MTYEPTNSDRACWANAALDAFLAACPMEGEDMETQIKDLITDLLHLARFEAGTKDVADLAAKAAAMAEIEASEDDDE